MPVCAKKPFFPSSCYSLSLSLSSRLHESFSPLHTPHSISHSISLCLSLSSLEPDLVQRPQLFKNLPRLYSSSYRRRSSRYLSHIRHAQSTTVGHTTLTLLLPPPPLTFQSNFRQVELTTGRLSQHCDKPGTHEFPSVCIFTQALINTYPRSLSSLLEVSQPSDYGPVFT